MRTINLSIILLLFFTNLSCQKELSKESISKMTTDECELSATERGFVFRDDGKKWLWGGENDAWHFDITDWTLRECQLNYGLGWH